jgi:putative hemolysin
MDPLIGLYIGLIVFFIVMCAFYSSTETAFGCLNKYKFKVEADDGSKTAALIVRLYDHFDTTLISVLIGNNVFAIAISTVSTWVFMDFFKGILDDNVISLIASIVMAVISYLFGDTIPKMVAKKIPNKIAKINVYPMEFFIILFYPVSLVYRGFTWLLKKIFRTKTPPELTPEDFNNVLESVEKKGALEANETDIIQASFDFADTAVKDVLTPVKKMTMLDLKGLSKEKLLLFLDQTNYSRIPMYYEDPNKIVGILIVKNFLAAYYADPSVSIMSALERPYFVSPKVMIDDLIEGFRVHQTQIAVVLNEGKVVGMVTTEDVLEELVGSIDEMAQPTAGGKS